MIRRLRPVDLLRPGFLDGLYPTDYAVTLDRVGNRGDEVLTPGSLLRESLTFNQSQCCWVAEEARKLAGVAAGRIRAGPRAWEISRLWLAPDAQRTVSTLLERVCLSAAEHGALRVFLRVPKGNPVSSVATQVGFVPLFHETLFRWQNPSPGVARSPMEGFRRCSSVDDLALFRFFLASVPAPVRNSCALTLEEWRDVQERGGGKQLAWVYQPTPGEARARIVAWWGHGARYLAVEVLPNEPQLSILVNYGLSLHPGVTPLCALVPDFQGHVRRELECRGFVPEREFTVLVRSLAALERKVALAPAGI